VQGYTCAADNNSQLSEERRSQTVGQCHWPMPMPMPMPMPVGNGLIVHTQALQLQKVGFPKRHYLQWDLHGGL